MYKGLQKRMGERKRLAVMISKYGINDTKTIKQSEKLDKLIVDYLKRPSLMSFESSCFSSKTLYCFQRGIFRILTIINLYYIVHYSSNALLLRWGVL